MLPLPAAWKVRTVTGLARIVASTSAALILLAGCSTGTPGEPDPAGGGLAPSGPCWRTVTTAAEAAATLAEVRPGNTVCLTGEGLAEVELELDRSGAPGAPITLTGGGEALLAGVRIEADDVVVQGVTVADGAGIQAAGRRLVIRDNDLHEVGVHGIACSPCDDARIERNVVRRADGAGVFAEGDRILIEANTITDSVMREAGDADGIRFFGSGLRIVDNTIADIKDDGYTSPPHTDCFQTYDNSIRPTKDVHIEGNTCRNVDHQCLIATAEEAGTSGEVGRSHGIRFVDNVCEVEGRQAVLIRWFTDVHLEDNAFDGPNLDRVAYFGDGSLGGRFLGNRVPERVQPVQVDETSDVELLGAPTG